MIIWELFTNFRLQPKRHLNKTLNACATQTDSHTSSTVLRVLTEGEGERRERTVGAG